MDDMGKLIADRDAAQMRLTHAYINYDRLIDLKRAAEKEYNLALHEHTVACRAVQEHMKTISTKVWDIAAEASP